ncbi:MAG: hypothetical protein AB9834_12670 [Lentimicrobium sp.]
MKVENLDYYAKFIFSSEDDAFCLSTTDIKVLRQIKSCQTDEIKRDYSIGDVIYFDTDEERDIKMKVIDIRIWGIVDRTETLNSFIDSSECKVQYGKINEPLFLIRIIIERFKD